MKSNKLTVILTLRGRHLHTLRWMWHANRIGFPYHVIIADGEVHPTIDRLLSDPARFPNLSFEYHRHNDKSYGDFYKKCTETVKKVRTDFVMMSDNDDFVINTGVQKSLTFLAMDTTYVCAGGQLPQFSVAPHHALPGKVLGQMAGLKFGYTHECRDISFASAAERVMDEIKQYQPIYYHVYRTEIFRTIFEEIERHDFSDLTVHEDFCALRAVTLGKAHTDPSVVCYLRQTGTSSSTTYWVDWVHNFLRSRLPQDYRTLAMAISKEAAKGDTDPAELNEAILNAFANKIRHLLGHTMMRYRFPALFAFKQRFLRLADLWIFPSWYKRKWERMQYWRQFAKFCADPRALAGYREDFEQIEASLQDDGFLSFIKANAPELLPPLPEPCSIP
jgi:glycosyltransferase domain-containing protein